MNINNESYILSIFGKIIAFIEANLDEPELYWFKETFANEPISFNKLKGLSIQDKIKFVKGIVLIHGQLDSCKLKSVQHKKTTWRSGFRDLEIVLDFPNESEEEIYQAFHRELVGVTAMDACGFMFIKALLLQGF